MSPRQFVEFLTSVLTIVVLIGVGVMGGYQYGTETVRNEAIKAGAAEWVIDPATGEVRLQWRSLSDEP